MTRIPTEAEYLAREAEIFARDLRQAERGTAEEKREAAENWFSDMANDPGLVAERVDWLLAGHYGKGAYDAAWSRVLAWPDAKPSLLETIAALEWSTPRRYHDAFALRLTEAQKVALGAVIDEVLEQQKRYRKENEG